MIRTGSDYKDSIRGTREVYINGDLVRDVTTHPAFRPIVDIRARIFDMQHELLRRQTHARRDDVEGHENFEARLRLLGALKLANVILR